MKQEAATSYDVRVLLPAATVSLDNRPSGSTLKVSIIRPSAHGQVHAT